MKTLKKNEQGISTIIIIVLVVVIALGVVGYVMYTKTHEPSMVEDTSENEFMVEESVDDEELYSNDEEKFYYKEDWDLEDVENDLEEVETLDETVSDLE